jgi:glucan phosphoethanolaminetransferase (alkaline phosphatase superfamily)
LSVSPNPIATTHMPFFVTSPGETDVLFNITLWFVVACIVLTGVVFLTIHSLPERMAHKSKKVLLDLIALLCLLALLTHNHFFWFVAIVLAFIDIPDFLTPVNRIANSMESIAGQEAGEKPADASTLVPPEAAKVDEPHVKKQGARHA